MSSIPSVTFTSVSARYKMRGVVISSCSAAGAGGGGGGGAQPTESVTFVYGTIKTVYAEQKKPK